jgi:hypothetical protein
MFGNEHLKALVECAGRALEYEDRYLAGCACIRGWATKLTGILGNVTERYYQFVVWSALMSSFPWRPHTEVKGGPTNHPYDLAFYKGDSDEIVALAEVKVLWGDRDEAHVPAVQTDIDMLKQASVPGVVLIMNGLRKVSAEEYLRWLGEKIKINREGFATYTFNALPHPDDPPGPVSFVVVGFFVPQDPAQA